MIYMISYIANEVQIPWRQLFMKSWQSKHLYCEEGLKSAILSCHIAKAETRKPKTPKLLKIQTPNIFAGGKWCDVPQSGLGLLDHRLKWRGLNKQTNKQTIKWRGLNKQTNKQSLNFMCKPIHTPGQYVVSTIITLLGWEMARMRAW